MSGSRRRSRANVGLLVALLLAVTVGCGCGDAQVGSPASRQSSHSADPPAAAAVREGRVKVLSTKTSATDTSTGPKRPHPIPPAHPVPAAFRPAAGAPSDAEVRSELAQLDALQRRQRQQQLSAAAANLAGLLPWSLEPRSGVQVSVASVFRDYGLGLACGGLLGRDQLGVAHKTAPCGTLITFTYGGRSVTVPVIDRGPYIVGREWDLTGATAAALAFPGLGQIAWSVAR
jgi:rare lipoprotein A (peptidoglycan hydrolase)